MHEVKIMSSIYVTVIVFIYLAQTGHGLIETYTTQFNSSGDIRHKVPAASYFIPNWSYNATYGLLGFISRYEINFVKPVEGITLKFQVWEKHSGIAFIFKGENVFENVKGEGLTYLYPNDVDQINVYSDYTVGLYVDEYSYIPYTVEDCDQHLRIYDTTTVEMPALFLGEYEFFSEYVADGRNSCMEFAFSVEFVKMNTDCKLLEIESINDEFYFTTDKFSDLGAERQCWNIRMMRPCVSSYKTQTNPSVKQMYSKMDDCNKQRVLVHDGGTSKDKSWMVCGSNEEEGQTYNGNSTVMHIKYMAGVPVKYFQPFKMKYFFNIDNNGLPDDFQYCEGEYDPKARKMKRLKIGLSVGLVLLFTVIILVIACYCHHHCRTKDKKPETTSDSPTPTTNGTWAATGSSRPMVIMNEPAAISEQPYQKEANPQSTTKEELPPSYESVTAPSAPPLYFSC